MNKKKQRDGVAYSYIRFSRVEQADGDSLRRQTELTRTWCDRNAVPLDESLTFRDLGVSAFQGGHRENPDRHALAAFLEAVKTGRVRPGSFLVIENLDRLSREYVRAAVKLFLDILDAGIHIVTTAPERVFRSDTQDMTDIIIAVVELSRGHSESARRSERCGRAWAEKKRKAAADKVPITRLVPAWLEVQDGKFRLIPDKAKVIRRIYQMAQSGYGIDSITKKLNAEKVTPISQGKGRGKHWSTSYIAAILSNPAVYGLYQPMKGKFQTGNPKAREPDGEPVAGYFPAVVTEDEWHATRGAVESRRRARGRRGTVVNVFKGLLWDARTHTPMHMLGHRRGGKGKNRGGPAVIYPYAYTLGESPFISFPLPVFEAAIFSKLREINPSALLPNDRSADEVLTLAGKLASLEVRIEAIKRKLAGEAADLEPLVDVLRTLDADRKTVAHRLEEAQQRAACPVGQAWEQAHSLLETLNTAQDQDDARTRLRAALKRITSEVWTLIVRRGDVTLCAVQMLFSGTNKQRGFLILSRPARSGFLRVARPAQWSVTSNAWTPPEREPFDLRKPGDAVALEECLRKLDLSQIGAETRETDGLDKSARSAAVRARRKRD